MAKELSSPHFKAIVLAPICNVDRATLPDAFEVPEILGFGEQTIQGIPFHLGQEGQDNLLLLSDSSGTTLELGGVQATYLVFLHAVEDRVSRYQEGLADFAVDGNELGDQVSEYVLEYEDGETVSTEIRRRFAIQQSHIHWGASPFEAVPVTPNRVFPTVSEEALLNRVPRGAYGRGETRHAAGRDSAPTQAWLYALANPHPDRPIRRLVLTSGEERSVIYGIAATRVADHPLRARVRRKLRLALPPGVELNDLGELEAIRIDLGTVISARAMLAYDRARWMGTDPNVQPHLSQRDVIVEYVAHPQARLFVGSDENQQIYDLSDIDGERIDGGELAEVAPARRPVRLRIVEKGSSEPVPVRLHLHGQAGEYLPPKNHHRKVNGYWFEDNYGEFVNSLNQYSYVDGICEVDLPLGEVYVEATRGYEVRPLRTAFTVTPETDEVILELERALDWRAWGWVTADTHVHFLSPQTALLEGQAEGVNVVNLLASQWGEMFSNVTDFDGKTTLGAGDFGGDGEFLVRVGTENRMQVLGHISLLGYSGQMILPLCSGGPSESAIGDPQEVVMAEWARRCIDQGGLVVMPHGPNPQCERAADIVLGLIHAMEMMTFNPFDAQINPYGIADWYRYLNLGYHLPICGGSDKMAASSLLGGVRTYAHLGQRAFSYANWMEAMRAGNTFVTVGPLAELQVEGQMPGNTLQLPAGGGTVNVAWKVESVGLPVEAVEVVVGSLTAEQTTWEKVLSAQGSSEIPVTDSTWIALRVRGSYRGEHGEIAAHTSAVQVLVEGSPLFNQADAGAVLEQIEGAIAYLDTIAPRPEARRLKQMRATLESAHNQLHQRMHRNGIFHDHATPNDHHG